MKLILVLFALIAVVAASYGDNNAVAADSVQPHYMRNRVFDEFDVGRRHHRGGHRGRRHKWNSGDSGSYEYDGYFFLPPISSGSNGGAANDAASTYGGASNDAPAATNYGTAAQNPSSGY